VYLWPTNFVLTLFFCDVYIYNQFVSDSFTLTPQCVLFSVLESLFRKTIVRLVQVKWTLISRTTVAVMFVRNAMFKFNLSLKKKIRRDNLQVPFLLINYIHYFAQCLWMSLLNISFRLILTECIFCGVLFCVTFVDVCCASWQFSCSKFVIKFMQFCFSRCLFNQGEKNRKCVCLISEILDYFENL
jgi:hypothetical protein